MNRYPNSWLTWNGLKCLTTHTSFSRGMIIWLNVCIKSHVKTQNHKSTQVNKIISSIFMEKTHSHHATLVIPMTQLYSGSSWRKSPIFPSSLRYFIYQNEKISIDKLLKYNQGYSELPYHTDENNNLSLLQKVSWLFSSYKSPQFFSPVWITN